MRGLDDSWQPRGPPSPAHEVAAVGQDDPQTDAILSGQAVPPDIVRGMRLFQIKVFVCSTPTDMEEERSAVMAEIVPKLVAYAREKHGLEFHYVDLRWANKNAADDYGTREFFMKELLRCQQLSVGPNFVAFVGQKYGRRRPPALMAADAFETIRKTLYEHRGRKARGAALLDKWYLKDTNSVPPLYVLQAPPAIAEAAVAESANEAQLGTATNDELGRLMQVLRYGVELCCKEGSLPPNALRDYFVSDFESELKQGTAIHSDNDALVFVRNIEDLQNYVSETRAATFTDVTWNDDAKKWEQDAECAALLSGLVQRAVRARLPEQRVHEFGILWRFDSGVHPVLHRPYILDFCNSFHKNVLAMIDRAATEAAASGDGRAPASDVSGRRLLFHEVVAHWRHALAVGGYCLGRQSVIAAAINYLTSREISEPMVLHGDPGVGKSTVMAAIQLELQKLPLVDTVIVSRFVGLTRSSSDALPLLYSICQQIHHTVKTSAISIPTDASKLSKYFGELLNCFPADRSLIVLLDGLDLLPLPTGGRDGASQHLRWLPRTVGGNVKILVSASTSKNDVLSRLKNELLPRRHRGIDASNDSFIELRPPTPEACLDLLAAALRRQEQRLAPCQHTALLAALRRRPTPLHARLLLSEAERWRSFDAVDESWLPRGGGDAVDACVTWLLERLESRHGRLIVERSLSYLTASAFGLSDLEIDELLSADGAVAEALRHRVDRDHSHSPTQPRLSASWRAPPHVWARLRDDLGSLLVLREIDERNVYCWFNACLADGVHARYLSNAAAARAIHSAMADYYLARWQRQRSSAAAAAAAERTPPSGHGGGGGAKRGRIGPSQDQAAADARRRPLAAATAAADAVRPSARVYSELPAHLHQAGRLDELAAAVVFDYEWIHSKARDTSLLSVVCDVRLLGGRADARLLECALRGASPRLLAAGGVDGLAPELVGRLLPHCERHAASIGRLVAQCESVGVAHCALVPAFGYPSAPGSPLRLIIDDDRDSRGDSGEGIVDEPLSLCIVGDGGAQLLAKRPSSPLVRRYDVASGRLLHTVAASLGHLHLPPGGGDGWRVVVVDGDAEKSLKVHDGASGEFLGQFIPCNHCDVKSPSRCRFDAVSVAEGHACLVVGDDDAAAAEAEAGGGSHLCVCALPSCDFRKAARLDGRANVACVAPNGRFVLCSSGKAIESHRLSDAYELVDSTPLDRRPTCIAVAASSAIAFAASGGDADADGVITVLHLAAATGRTQMVTKLPLRGALGAGDRRVRKLVTATRESLLAVLGADCVLVYSCALDKIVLSVRRPPSAPAEFRLPRRRFPTAIGFTDAAFTGDDRHVMCAIFREVQVWSVRLGVELHVFRAPIGVVSRVLHSSRDNFALTASTESSRIHVWDLGDDDDDGDESAATDSSSRFQAADHLTGPIACLRLSLDGALCFSSCDGGDEVGVYDVGSGQLRHLLTHESPVVDFAPSADGEHVLVSLAPSAAKQHCCRLWYVRERRVLRAFGVAPGASVALTTQNAFVHFAPRSRDFKAPYGVTQFTVSENAVVRETEAPFSLSFVVGEPFATANDKYLVVLTAESYVEHEARYTRPSILAFALRSGLSYKLYDENELGFLAASDRTIKEARPVKNVANQVVAIYALAGHRGGGAPPFGELSLGFFLLDLHSGVVLRYNDAFAPASTSVRDIHFSTGGALCVNARTGVAYSMASGEPLATIGKAGADVRLMCDGKSVAYRRGCGGGGGGAEIVIERVLDNRVIARCPLEGDVTCVEVGHDEQTLVLGLADGSVLAYVLVDGEYSDVAGTLSAVRNRRARSRWLPSDDGLVGGGGPLWDSAVPRRTGGGGGSATGGPSEPGAAAAVLSRSRSTSAANALPLDRDRLKALGGNAANGRPKTSNGYAATHSGYTTTDRALLLSRASSKACRLM